MSNNRKVTNFTIAINRTYMQNGEKVNKAVFVDCSYWVNSGVAEYLEKGALVLIYGDMDCNSFGGKKSDGEATAKNSEDGKLKPAKANAKAKSANEVVF